MKTHIFFASFLMLSGAAGCANLPADAADAEIADSEADTATPVAGTYSNSGDVDNTGFYALTLSADGTFGATGGCRPGPTGPHCFAISHRSGTWSIGKVGKKKALVLVDSFNQTSSYPFTFKNDVLTLTNQGEKNVFDLVSQEVVTSTPAAIPAGDYVNEGDVDTLPFYALTLADDGSFRATGGCRPQPGAAATCHAISVITGTFSLAWGGPQLGRPQGQQEITFTDSFGQVSTYAYAIDGSTLTILTGPLLGGQSANVFTAQ